MKLFAIPPKTSPKHGSTSPHSANFGGPLKTTILGSPLKMCDPEDEEEKEYDCLDEHDDEDKSEGNIKTEEQGWRRSQ